MCHLVYSQLNKNNGPSNLQELSHVPNYYILYINVLTGIFHQRWSPSPRSGRGIYLSVSTSTATAVFPAT